MDFRQPHLCECDSNSLLKSCTEYVGSLMTGQRGEKNHTKSMPGLAGLEAVTQRYPMVCTLARCQQFSIGRGDPESFVSEHQKVTMTQTCGSHCCIPGVKLLRKDKRSSPLASSLPLKNKMARLIFKHQNFTLKCSNPTVHRSQRHTGEEVAKGVKFYQFEQNFELWPEHTSNFESDGSRP